LSKNSVGARPGSLLNFGLRENIREISLNSIIKVIFKDISKNISIIIFLNNAKDQSKLFS